MLLNKIPQLKCENNEDSTASRKLTLKNPLNPAQENLFIMVPRGKSDSSHYMKTVKEMVTHHQASQKPEDQKEIKHKSVVEGIRALARLDPGAFAAVAQQHGHVAAPKISANFWVAMSTTAGL